MARGRKTTIILENVVIESVAAEGKSLAHAKLPAEPEETTPRVLFVPFAVPGDVVDVMITRRKKSFMEGKIVRIVEPSPRRLEPFCKHFGTCGGCKWQILPYDLQLEAKQRQVYDQLVRIGHLDVPEIRPVLGSAKTVEYRNKLEFTASSYRWVFPDEEPEKLSEAERVGLGFHVGKFFDKVLDIEHCYLQREPSNQIRLFVKKYALEHGIPFFNLREKTGILRNMFVRTAENQQVMLIVCFGQDFPGREAFLDAIAAEFPSISSLYYIINAKVNDSVTDQECILYKGDEAIYESMEGLTFKIGPKSFYQTNTEQAYVLYKVAREFADLSGDEVVYDLYTGTGTIAQFVSSKASKVIGIEYVPEAIEDACENARRNGISNCDFFAGDMKDILTDGFIEDHGRPDVIILDPPRAGIHPDVAKVILNAAPKRIVYVSCNPASQARDLAALSVKYKVTAVQPVDMFPHTQHVENVCRLELL
ncbi:MAG: 23S rRNA (uracil(1939)-C(5))-methyltransferase RlmD [Bacteroidales bacterium]|nr:23S rRNA (uracil(1939)-C(5))-methyltransferase RlmD [Bacteroidales bacterium]